MSILFPGEKDSLTGLPENPWQSGLGHTVKSLIFVESGLLQYGSNCWKRNCKSRQIREL